MTPNLSDLKEMAYAAGEIIRNGYNQAHSIKSKGTFDVVTEIDHKSEALILQAIHSRFTNDYIVTEESGELGSQKQRTWYIDPLDGTINFSHNVPYFGVSIGYAVEGILQFGAVYNPLLDELFTAERGKGATLNGKPIKVSATTELTRCLFVNEYSNEPAVFEINQRNVGHFNQCSQGIRRPGSCVLDLCYVAAGRYEGFWAHHAFPWDFAAGGLIALEAGAQVTDIRGNSDFLTPPCSILAAPPAVHTQLLQALHK